MSRVWLCYAAIAVIGVPFVRGDVRSRASEQVARAVEVVIACVALLLALPVLLAACIAIRLESPGPVLFVQTRVGRNGRAFRIYKLRTMHVGTSERPTHLMAGSDLTRVGVLLRRSKLDELPQLINVLEGSMGLVGPRPSLVSQAALIEGRRWGGVLSVRPGITGLAQALRVDMSDVGRLVAIDSHYVATRSLTGDLRIMAATVLGRWLLAPRGEARSA